MVRKWKAGVLSLLLMAALAGCAVAPPVQEMAEARSAIDAAKQIHSAQPQAKRELKSAEQALQEAASAIDREQYELARRKALEAKRKAQHAAQFHDK
jgi:TolA-binding protein